MATCKNCGAKTGSGASIVVAIVGELLASFVGVPMLIVVLVGRDRRRGKLGE